MVKRDLILQTLLGAMIVLILVLLRLFVFSTYRVPEGEANTYLQKGDIVLVHAQKEIAYKDFVVYEVDGKTHMGRVVALPNESITYMDDIFYLNNDIEGQSYIESLKRDYLSNPNRENPYTSDFTVATLAKNPNIMRLPKDHYVILNDDRQNQADSRQFGLIDKKEIRGVVTFRLLPFKTFGFVEVE